MLEFLGLKQEERFLIDIDNVALMVSDDKLEKEIIKEDSITLK